MVDVFVMVFQLIDTNENSNAKETLIDTKNDVELCRSSSTESKFSLETPWGIVDPTHPAPESICEVPSKEFFKVRLSRVRLSSLPAIDERLKKDAKDEDQIHDLRGVTMSTEGVTTQMTKKLGFFGRLRRCFLCLATDRRHRRKQTTSFRTNE
ncbi:hypothetical protein CHS0354_041269 [Potamilus streckersoni]|uniref:Uncharacterized protein n=1 Tax=Potamilus streckersoni TaxID=2493646 RepID=A0AAE0SEI3_9BIVA|nr:hypothetical protein CHS0354_041269 [Potamilus streckersoni]